MAVGSRCLVVMLAVGFTSLAVLAGCENPFVEHPISQQNNRGQQAAGLQPPAAAIPQPGGNQHDPRQPGHMPAQFQAGKPVQSGQQIAANTPPTLHPSVVPPALVGREVLAEDSFVTNDFRAALVVRPQLIQNARLLAPLGKRDLRDLLAKAPSEELGIDVRALSRLTMLVGIDQRDEVNSRRRSMACVTAYVMEFVETIDPVLAVKASLRDPQPAQLAGKNFYVQGPKSNYRPVMAAYFPNNRAMVLTDLESLERMLGGKVSAGPLARLLADAPVDRHALLVGIGDNELQRNLAELSKQTGGNRNDAAIGEALQFLKNVRSLKLALDLDHKELLRGEAQMVDADAATALANLANVSLKSLKQTFDAQKDQLLLETSPEMATVLPRVIDQLVLGTKVAADGSRLSLQVATPSDLGGLVAALVPQIRLMRKQAEQADARKDMIPLARALREYEAEKGYYPTNIVDRQGRPTLSWRVALLPYLGEKELYRDFRIDEPWNSAHNIRLLDQMPAVLQRSGTKPTNRTRYMAAIGPKTPLGSVSEGSRIRRNMVVAGKESALAVVETGPDMSVPWTQPEDMPFDPADPWKGLGQVGEGFPALYYSGQLVTIPRTMPADNLRMIFQIIEPARAPAVAPIATPPLSPVLPPDTTSR